ncbi:tyrosine-protein phosphatase [Fictibacillus sp. NRS-1165]|uniref:tyrosine-protein phosphatase n=1 Tax=Fictibacillus sp. NRS-1165 TaxID=3144463 RepID=UPI003D1A834E
MIDIHSHILPGIDDGAPNIEVSLEMARCALDQGITYVIATPHHRNGMYENEKSFILEQVEQLNNRLMEEGLPLTVLPGQELRIQYEIPQNLEQLLSLNHTKYMFIEFSFTRVPNYSHELFHEMLVKGFVPVIVHPERNTELQENPELLYEFVQQGALTQVTAGSVLGYFGKKCKSFSQELISHGLTHFISSDAHNVSTRGFCLREAYEEITKQFGVSKTTYFQQNAHSLVEGRTIPAGVPDPIRSRKLVGIL